MGGLVPYAGADGGHVSGDVQRFEGMLFAQLAAAGLPMDGVLVELEERHQALVSFGAVPVLAIRRAVEDTGNGDLAGRVPVPTLITRTRRATYWSR